MDTSRLIINTIDKSSYTEENSTSLSGFTVVKAPKGPIYPVRIPAGGAAKIQDIFGVSSRDYPELFEVETFNKEYDVYVSAPYASGTKVNVAYVTNDGIFSGSDEIEYDEELESVILGFNDDISSNVASKFKLQEGGSVEVLKDYRYSFTNNILNIGTYVGERTGDSLKSLTSDDVSEGDIFLCTSDSSLSIEDSSTFRFKKGNKYIAILTTETITTEESTAEVTTLSWSTFNDLGESEYPGYVVIKSTGKSALLINTGIPFKFFNKEDNFELPFKIKGLSSSLKDDFKFEKKTSTGETTTVSYKILSGTDVKVGELVAMPSSTANYEPISASTAGAVKDEDIVAFLITGSDQNGIISQSYIANSLDSDEERASLQVFFTDSILTSKVHGVICPKFASERDLHISFSAFDSLINYRSSNPLDRNLLKMTVYEDGAFRDASHKLSINGSLKISDVDSNGASIGFSPSNSSYDNQDLIYVYTYKEFSKGDDINTRISRYPSITIFGGKREFGSDEVVLHNKGWEKALDSDFSNVSIFFDSQDNTGKSLSDLRGNDRFFSLVNGSSDGHNLTGYIFNYTASPSEVDGFTKSANYLSFGRNYWNVDNMAVMVTEDGSKFFSTMTGAKALMQCRIIENRWGGVAPMWENSGTPGLGGQLDMINPLRLRYKYTKSQLDTLDKFNYNPVINDRQYGIMVVGHKTCKPGAITDWSYIGHACSFFNFIKEIRNNVMIPQIGKANNPYYRDLRNKQVSQYLRDRLTGDNRIWAEGKVDTSTADGVNDVHALKALKFVINVSVKVDIFSESVELNFTNEDQSTSVSFEAD